MGGCCRWGWLVRQGDTPDEARIKTIVFPFAIFEVVLHVGAILHVLRSTKQGVSLIAYCINTFGLLLFIGGVLWNAVPPGHLLDVLLLLCTLGLCTVDLANATRSWPFRSWSFVVLVLDGALVFKRYHMPYFIIPLVLVHQAALAVESVSRFGLYEAGYWGSKGVESSQCNC
eukprot:Hpha_TRINITY_DN15384_c3_g1::TRINITY_DN15384_c3_g1_i11::g.88073::m.88073